jgi:hypothetical protein
MIEKFRRLDSADRMIVDVNILPGAMPLPCIIDTGASDVLLPYDFGAINHVKLPTSVTKEFNIDGFAKGWLSNVSLILRDIMGEQQLTVDDVPAYFCKPWHRRRQGNPGEEDIFEPRGYGILGIKGFLDLFELTVWAHHKLFRLETSGFDVLPPDLPLGLSRRMSAGSK